jgi:hypothetical protein
MARTGCASVSANISAIEGSADTLRAVPVLLSLTRIGPPHNPLISRRRRFTALHASENTRSVVVTANQPRRFRAADAPRP